MAETANAIAHLDAARQCLLMEAYHVSDAGEETVDHFTIAEDLRRIDAAIGPVGTSIFARIADCISEAYVEIVAARRALSEGGE